MKVIFHQNFHQAYTADPAAAPGRMEAIMDVLESKVEIVRAVSAEDEDIAAVHTRRHIDGIKRRGLYPIASLAAGGAIQAAEIGLREPCLGLIRPPGHHASSDSAWGFCFFNNMAVAIETLHRRRKISSAHILDFDLHFGDGTVNILEDREYVTIHNPQAADRQVYLDEVAGVLNRCQADIIGISAGFDNHVLDWGGLLDTDDYRQMGRLVRAAAARTGGGCFAVLEGGYNHQVIGRNAMALIQGLSEGGE